MVKIVSKLNNLDSVSKDISIVRNEMKNMEPMLNNMNISMVKIQKINE